MRLLPLLTSIVALCLTQSAVGLPQQRRRQRDEQRQPSAPIEEPLDHAGRVLRAQVAGTVAGIVAAAVAGSGVDWIAKKTYKLRKGPDHEQVSRQSPEG